MTMIVILLYYHDSGHIPLSSSPKCTQLHLLGYHDILSDSSLLTNEYIFSPTVVYNQPKGLLMCLLTSHPINPNTAHAPWQLSYMQWYTAIKILYYIAQSLMCLMKKAHTSFEELRVSFTHIKSFIVVGKVYNHILSICQTFMLCSIRKELNKTIFTVYCACKNILKMTCAYFSLQSTGRQNLSHITISVH